MCSCWYYDSILVGDTLDLGMSIRVSYDIVLSENVMYVELIHTILISSGFKARLLNTKKLVGMMETLKKSLTLKRHVIYSSTAVMLRYGL